MKNSLCNFIFVILITYSYAQKINGISYVASRDSVKPENVKPVLAVNANFVTLMPFAYVPSNEAKVYYNSNRQWFGESEEGIMQYSNQFKKNGIDVLIKPQLWARGKYTGHIDYNSEEEWKTFEDTYENFILTFAKIANKVDAKIFCIGTELEIFVKKRPVFWKELIKKIRNLYKGKLTYAANWDEFKRVTFWHKLDYIGIDAYFPVTDKKTPSVLDYEEGWKPHKKEIENIQKQYQKQILFTEFGYRSINFAGKEPWESKRVLGEVNLNAQSNGLQAIYNQFWKEDWFAGGFVWKWFLNHKNVGGLNNNRFTPQNKPAESLLTELYKNEE